MAKVFVINSMNHDFSKAEKFGMVVNVTEGKVPIFKTDIAKNMLREGLQGFNIEQDYLLIAGPALLSVLAFMICMDGPTPIQALVFDAKQQDYVVRHLSI